MYVFLSCTSTKADKRCTAEEMYSESTLFKYALKYARTLTEDKNIFILSAKHHLLRLNKVIAPYNVTLIDMSVDDRKKWTNRVISLMEDKGIDFGKKAVFLAGDKYVEFLKGKFSQEEYPLDGKPIGETLGWLKNKVGAIDECLSLVDYLSFSL